MSVARAQHVLTAVSFLAVVALALAACGGTDSRDAADGRLLVVTSTNVWGAVVKAVGGDRVEVRSVIRDPSADPHSYQATAEDAADVQSARLLVYNGGGYDDFFAQLAEQAPDVPAVVAVDVSAHAAETEGHDHGHEAGNEHVWYDLPTVAGVADAVAARLGEADPAARTRYADNAAAFDARLADVGTKIDRIAADHAGERVLATEPVATYLIERAKLVDATPHAFSEAVGNETDVPIAAQQQILGLVSRDQVAAVVNNAQTVTPVTEKVVGAAREAGVPVVSVTETLPEGVDDYISWMDAQVSALAGALNKS